MFVVLLRQAVTEKEPSLVVKQFSPVLPPLAFKTAAQNAVRIYTIHTMRVDRQNIILEEEHSHKTKHTHRKKCKKCQISSIESTCHCQVCDCVHHTCHFVWTSPVSSQCYYKAVSTPVSALCVCNMLILQLLLC